MLSCWLYYNTYFESNYFGTFFINVYYEDFLITLL